MACSCLSLMDFQLYLGSFSISTPSPAWIAAARGKARGFAGEARSLLASEKNLLITPPKTIKNAQGFAGMVDPRTRPVISRFPYVYICSRPCHPPPPPPPPWVGYPPSPPVVMGVSPSPPLWLVVALYVHTHVFVFACWYGMLGMFHMYGTCGMHDR